MDSKETYYYLFNFYRDYDKQHDMYLDLIEVEVLSQSFEEAVVKAKKQMGIEQRGHFVIKKIIVKTDKN